MAQAYLCRGCDIPIVQSGRGRPSTWCAKCKDKKPVVIPVTGPKRNAELTAEQRELTVYGTTLAKLQEYGRVEDALGQTALVLARALDAGRGGGIGLAAIAREHREALAAACAGAKGVEDALDALGRRLA